MIKIISALQSIQDSQTYAATLRHSCLRVRYVVLFAMLCAIGCTGTRIPNAGAEVGWFDSYTLWSLSLDSERYIYAPGKATHLSATASGVLARGIAHENHSWDELKSEIHKLGALPNPLLLIWPASHHEQYLEMIKSECRNAGVLYIISSPIEGSLEDYARYSDGCATDTMPVAESGTAP